MTAKKQTGRGKAGTAEAGFSAEERAAMKERAAELKAEKRSGKNAAADGEADVLAKIAEMPEGDRALAERIHTLVNEHAPALTAKTWYGMPAYARDGNVVCFFQSSHRFKARYATLGFSDKAKIDDGEMWAVAYALTEMSAETEARIAALLKKAAR